MHEEDSTQRNEAAENERRLTQRFGGRPAKQAALRSVLRSSVSLCKTVDAIAA
jgi:hypothetical protein